jgi:rhamnulokinase
MGNYLAFDLGAESCRAILGNLDDNKKLQIKTLHRSPNGMMNIRGRLQWDVLGMYREILTGMTACAAQCGDKVESAGIDSWAVDFGLFDEQGMLLGNPAAYRDANRVQAMTEFLKKMPPAKLYELTGISIGYVNSVFQLFAFAHENNPQLKIAKDLLFIPDIFNYFLTGKKASEFTFATTSQLYNTRTGAWEKEIFTKLGVNPSIMQKIVPHGTIIGKVDAAIGNETGVGEIPMIAVGSHDTGSAVAACPLPNDNAVYISSGTWSLIGIETKAPIINEKTFKYNITNEGGICGTFRVLKNLTGLWLLQEYRREEAKTQHTFDQFRRRPECAGVHQTGFDGGGNRRLLPEERANNTAKHRGICADDTGEPGINLPLYNRAIRGSERQKDHADQRHRRRIAEPGTMPIYSRCDRIAGMRRAGRSDGHRQPAGAGDGVG